MVWKLCRLLWNDTSRFQYGWEGDSVTHLDSYCHEKRYITSEAILFILRAGFSLWNLVSCSYAPRAFFPFWGAHVEPGNLPQAIPNPPRSLMPPPPPAPVPILLLLWCQWWGMMEENQERGAEPIRQNCRQREVCQLYFVSFCFPRDFQDMQILSGLPLVLCHKIKFNGWIFFKIIRGGIIYAYEEYCSQM